MLSFSPSSIFYLSIDPADCQVNINVPCLHRFSKHVSSIRNEYEIIFHCSVMAVSLSLRGDQLQSVQQSPSMSGYDLFSLTFTSPITTRMISSSLSSTMRNCSRPITSQLKMIERERERRCVSVRLCVHISPQMYFYHRTTLPFIDKNCSFSLSL